ncbi:hypothetical protein AB1K54_09860 [Microbacterium sp. BWT-B31]|uniref:hypothetical protein n=1 Tax=Microbacterium sp. BWT-B31 TaxID=3232072 RepID=UPI003528FF51
MRARERMPRLAALAVAALALGALPGCLASGPPASVCVPELTVTPDDPKPGRIVTVATTHACPVPDGTEWVVRIQPAGKPIPLAEAKVKPDGDGSFEVSITVPPTIGPGSAIAWIANYWDTAQCPSGASCASAEVTFTVAEP